MIAGIITATLFVAFLCIVFWAYSASNRERFADAANLPFADEAAAAKRDRGPRREESDR